MHGEPYPPPTEFLEWLCPYVGRWLLRETTFEVDRRADGWLEASSPDGAKVSLTYLLKFGKKVGELDQPRGTRPVVLSYPFSIGRQRILELVEQRIREAPSAARLEFLRKKWEAAAKGNSI